MQHTTDNGLGTRLNKEKTEQTVKIKVVLDNTRASKSNI